jgi:hypothetical protein
MYLAFYDAKLTESRMVQHGIEVELNPLIKRFCRRIGIKWGVYLGIGVPTLLYAVLGFYWPLLLAFVVGTRFTLYLFQKRSQEMESPKTFVQPPVINFEADDEAHDVRRLDYATNDIMGPVVMGGRSSADCFRIFDSLQAGTCDPNAYGTSPLRATDGDEDDRNMPSRPW